MYKPGQYKNGDDVAEFIVRELNKLSSELITIDVETADLQPWYVLPPKPREGAIAFLVDSIVGISVTGLHQYKNGSWVKVDFTSDITTLTNSIDAINTTLTVEDWHVIGDPGEPSFNQNWGNYAGGGFDSAAFYIDPFDVVHLRGLIAATSGAGTVAFTLPTGYRPANNKLFSCWSNGVASRIDVAANGDIVYYGSIPTGYAQLDGLSFKI